MAIWSMTLPPESIGWGFLLTGASLVAWPWLLALLLGLFHLFTHKKLAYFKE
jgi:predicted membrane protein